MRVLSVVVAVLAVLHLVHPAPINVWTILLILATAALCWTIGSAR